MCDNIRQIWQGMSMQRRCKICTNQGQGHQQPSNVVPASSTKVLQNP